MRFCILHLKQCLSANLFCQELERQGFNLPEELVKAAIKEAKLIDDRDLARAAR